MKNQPLQNGKGRTLSSWVVVVFPLLWISMYRRCYSFSRLYCYSKIRQCSANKKVVLDSWFISTISPINDCSVTSISTQCDRIRKPGWLPLPLMAVTRYPNDEILGNSGAAVSSNYINFSKKQKRHRDESKMTFESAILIEAKLVHALETWQQQMNFNKYYNNHTTIQSIPLFPTARECNAAIATFGNNPKFFMRGLQMFVKMRKAASLHSKYNLNNCPLLVVVPAPTLVTYSTLMSRAVSCNKPQVALRLWKLMTMQSDFFANHPGNSTTIGTSSIIVPDTKAANILMNAYAKLGDVLSAKGLLQQMLSDSGGPDVPPLQPNLITYNTLIDACRRAGDLKTGLQLLQDMKLLSSSPEQNPTIKPDVRTYTSLISTVARKQQHTMKLSFGSKDPDMAFALLYEMMEEQNLRPNGMTFCALIDVCGRCGRVDLALVGLRIMLRQQKQQIHEEDDPISSVGAWTAAIDACGKAGRYNTAIRLFKTMESFGAKPNIVTCGCLVDCLLRAKEEEEGEEDANMSTKTIRIVETLLDLLRYMKENNMEPSEVMYTSLISFAGRLVRLEEEEERLKRSKKTPQRKRLVMSSQVLEMAGEKSMRSNSVFKDNELMQIRESGRNASKAGPRAIDVYTGLMKSMMRGSNSVGTITSVTSGSTTNTATTQSMLLKVFLVFQEMKGAGGRPDVACYNSLLRACARAGDVAKAQDVVREMEGDGFFPNDVTWKQLLKAAARSKNSLVAEQTWNVARGATNTTGCSYEWKPDMEAFEALIAAYWGEAFLSSASAGIDGAGTINSRVVTTTTPPKPTKSFLLMSKIIDLYEEVQMHSFSENNKTILSNATEKKRNDINGLSNLDLEELQGNQRLMLMILHSAVSMELQNDGGKESGAVAKNTSGSDVTTAARKIAVLVSTLACLSNQEKQSTPSPFFAIGNSLMRRVRKSLELARLWAEEERVTT